MLKLRQTKARQERMSRQQAAKLENMFTDMGADQVSKLNLIVKTDVRGSLEAINQRFTILLPMKLRWILLPLVLVVSLSLMSIWH